MKLAEYIETVKDTYQYLYIGSASAFVWIGHVSEALDAMDTLTTEHLAKWNGRLDDCRSEIAKAEKSIPEFKEQINGYERTIDRKKHELEQTKNEWVAPSKASMKRHNKRVRSLSRNIDLCEYEIKKKEKQINRCVRIIIDKRKEAKHIEEILKRFDPWLDREVRLYYKKELFEPYGMAVFTTGGEYGKYWLASEMIYGVDKEDEESEEEYYYWE